MNLVNKGVVLDTIVQIDSSECSQDVIDNFLEFIEPLGFSSFLISQVVNPLRADAKKAMRYSNWPDELINLRFSENQIMHDPIIQYGLKSKYAFSWETAYQYASCFGRKMMDAARDHRIAAGYSFPMRRPGSPIGGISLGGDSVDISEKDLASIELVAMHTYSRLETLHGQIPTEGYKMLSRQETEVLYFTAVGKTAWEAGGAMEITEAAVKDALKRARHKLGAMNTVHACSIAISEDLILP